MRNGAECRLKDITLIVWLTQLGLSVALPPAGFILLAVWLQNRYSWGGWVLWVGILLGCVCAVNGLRHSLKTMAMLAKDKPGERKEPPVSFNDHD